MPRKQILSLTEKRELISLPNTHQEIIWWYTFSEDDIIFIKNSTRGKINQFRLSIQLCYMRYPGISLAINERPDQKILNYVGDQLQIDNSDWENYHSGQNESRYDHINIVRKRYDYQNFTISHHKNCVDKLRDSALQTDKGFILAKELMNILREQRILLPSMSVIERICAEAVTKAEKEIYSLLSLSLTKDQKYALEGLLITGQQYSVSTFNWLMQSPAAANPKHILIHLSKLKVIKKIALPLDIGKHVHLNYLSKMAREGKQMTSQHLNDFEQNRKYATLIAVLLDIRETITDEIIEIHDKIMNSLFKDAKNKQNKELQNSGKNINNQLNMYLKLGTALLDARETGEDPFDAVESVISWEELTQSILETKSITKKENFDHLYLIGDHYSQIRKYAPSFLRELALKAAPIPSAQSILKAVEIIKQLNDGIIKKLPERLPTQFIRTRWENLIFTDTGISRKYYELCILSELKNYLRSGDIWVEGSRRYKDFEQYLISREDFSEMKNTDNIELNVVSDSKKYLDERFRLLQKKLEIDSNLAQNGEMVDAYMSNGKIKVKPLTKLVPKEAEYLAKKVYRLLPYVKITDLLIEVDTWTKFTDSFTHLKNGIKAEDKNLLLTTILSDGINLGLRKMAESSPYTSYAKLSQMQSWYIRKETYSLSLASIINYHHKHPFSVYWGEGKTSSSDGLRFATGSHAKDRGQVNPKYGSEPGTQFYTHLSDQYSPFYSENVSLIRDSTYMIDGLLYHESDLQIEEHYTDTAGFSDHVFALMHLLGFRFAPRIKDLSDKKIYLPPGDHDFSILSEHIGGTINFKKITQNWDDILRLAASIKKGTVKASLIIRKIGSYPRQNGLATALREFGKIERSLFMLDWYVDPALRRRVTIGLNKGEARNALARAVFFNRLGEIRNKSIESQKHQASGLNLLTAAIILWNTVYLERAVNYLKSKGEMIDENLLQYLSPLGWEHIHLTGNYVWPEKDKLKEGEFRKLRNQDNI